MTSLNVSPYYDDFDARNNFYKILFRPGVPVQARELTQIQSILQDQLKQVGDHLFKNGSMIIPGGTKHDLNVRAVRVSLLDANYDVSQAVGYNLVGGTSSVSAAIIKAEKNGGVATLYTKTVSNSQTNPSVSDFRDSEIVSVQFDGGLSPLGTTETGAVTPAALGFVSDGVYYVNGTFVAVHSQSVVLSSTSSAPSVKVGLVVSEEFITPNEDNSLLDPALGSSNENAPGAHRLKISLTLTKYDVGQETDPSFILLFELEDGNLVKLVDSTVYSELMKTLARRTYEESGNYTVDPYDFELKEQSPISAALNLFVTKGSAFVGGYEINNQFNRLSAVIPKARTYESKNNSVTRTSFGNFFYATNIYGFPRTWSYIELRDDTIVTPGTPVGNIIGFAKVRSVEKTSIANVYKVFIFDAEFSKNKSIQDVASYVELNSGTKGSGNVLSVIEAVNVSGTLDTTNNLVCQSAVTRSVVPVFFDALTNTVWAKKTPGAFTWVLSGDYLKQTTTNVVASVSGTSIIQDPASAVPMLRLPKAAIKSTSDYIYHVSRQISVALNASGAGNYSLPAGESFVDVSKVVCWNPSTGAIVTATVTEGATSLSISGGPASATVLVQTTVRKTTGTPKSKTKTLGTLVVPSADATKRTKISLGYVNVLSVQSITEGAKDITKSYILRTGDRDGAYGQSHIELSAGASLPAGSITVQFTYLVNSAGDFSSVGSYSSLGVDDSFIASIPTFVSSKGDTYKLEDVIDFRPTTRSQSVSVYGDVTSGSPTLTLNSGYSNGVLSSGLTVYGRGVSGTISSISSSDEFGVTLSANSTATVAGGVLIVGYDASTFSAIPAGQIEPIASVADFICDYEYYLPRIDSVFLSSAGELEVFRGVPSEKPVSVDVSDNELRMKLADLFVPAYTFGPKTVEVRKTNRRRYTMADIASIDRRVSAVEEYTSLNMLEQNLANMQVIDPLTGLNRFKSGFVVDNFKDHSVVDMSDATLAYLNYEDGTLNVLQDSTALQLVPVTGESSGVVIVDGMAILPYTEELLVDQSAATRPQNINPFAVFRWNGVLTTSPQSDFWSESQRLADVVIERTINI